VTLNVNDDDGSHKGSKNANTYLRGNVVNTDYLLTYGLCCEHRLPTYLLTYGVML